LGDAANTTAATVTVNPLPTLTVQADSAICSGSSATPFDLSSMIVSASGGADYDTLYYFIVNGGTVPTMPVVTITQDTMVQVTIRNTTTGCSIADTFRITLGALPEITSFTAKRADGTQGGEITACVNELVELQYVLATNGAVGPFTVTYTDGTTDVVKTLTTAGTFIDTVYLADSTSYKIVSVKDEYSQCVKNYIAPYTLGVDSLRVNILDPNPGVITVTAGGNVPASMCQGQQLQLSITGGDGNGIWSVSPDTILTITQTGLVTALKPGQASIIYTVVVNGCAANTSVAMKVNALPAAPVVTKISGTATHTCVSDTIVVTDSSGNTTGGVMYQLLKSDGTVYATKYGTGSALKFALNGSVDNDSYRAVAIPATGGCVSDTSTPVTINITDNLPTLVTKDTAICYNGTLDLAELVNNPDPGLTYTYWTIVNPVTQVLSPVTVTQNATYTVRAEEANTNNTCVSEAIVNITVNPLPATPVVTSVAVCEGAAQGTLPEAPAPNTYRWYDSNHTAIADPTTINLTTTTPRTDTYYVKQVSPEGCESDYAQWTYTVNGLPTLTLNSASADATLCTRGTFNNIIFTIGGTANSYTVTNLPSGIAASFNNPVITLSGTPTVAGTYNYTVSTINPFGCTEATISGTIQVDTVPAIPAIIVIGNTTFCEGDSVTLLANATDAHTYRWIKDGVTVQNGTDATYIAKVGGIYKLEVTHATGPCPSEYSEEVIVTVIPRPATPTYTVVGSTEFCDGGSVEFVIDGNPAVGDLFQWYRNDVPQGNPTSDVTYQVTVSGNYYVVLINSNNCAAEPSVVTSVTVNPVPAIPVIVPDGATEFCEGGSVLLTAISGIADNTLLTYQWLANGVEIPGATAYTYTTPTTLTGTVDYTVKVTSQKGCVSESVQVTTVTVYAAPQVPVLNAASIPGNLCEGSSVELTATPGDASDIIIWYKDGVEVGTGLTYSATTSGNYAIKARNANGCESEFSSTSVDLTFATQPARPSISSVSPVYLCEGEEVTLVAISTDPVASYNWYRDNNLLPETGSTLITGAPGVYTVEAVNSAGCTSMRSESVTVEVVAMPAEPVITYNGNIVAMVEARKGTDVTLEVSNPDIANVSYQWYLNNVPLSGQDDVDLYLQSITPAYAGVYTVKATSLLGNCAVGSTGVELKVLTHIKIINVLTPDGDGVNDVFVIEGLDEYISNDLTIVNRWGNQVFRMKNYDNSFKGDNLANGTYYYALRLKDANQQTSIKNGWFILKHK
jgi:gliding motility-associated-like protein